MPDLLTGTKALVTGAGRGIGTAIAHALAAEGAAVALAWRSSKNGAETAAAEIRAAGGTAVTLQADVAVAAEADSLVQRAADALGGLNVLVNNAAGFGPLMLIEETTWSDIDGEWQAVFRPVYEGTRAVLPIMKAGGGGRIVNLCATLVERPAIRYGAHTMAKSAVLALTRTLAREAGPFGITVNAVSPGTALTEFSSNLPEAIRKSLEEQTPLRRLAQPEDVAKAVLYFCSPWASFVTGANIAADGGLSVL